MFLLKKGVYCLGLLLALCTTLYAEDDTAYFKKNNAIAAKIGYQLYKGSDFTEFWGIDKKELNNLVGELSYESKLFKYMGIELALGYFKTHDRDNIINTITDNNYTIDDASISNVDIENRYFSPSVKFYIPVVNAVVFYFGGGPDFYCTDGTFRFNLTVNYNGNSYTVNQERSEQFYSWGYHGLAGIEFSLDKDPAKEGFYDAPVSIFLEYKYSKVNVKEYDGKVINDIDNISGLILKKHDLDVGGNKIFTGLRWHF